MDSTEDFDISVGSQPKEPLIRLWAEENFKGYVCLARYEIEGKKNLLGYLLSALCSFLALGRVPSSSYKSIQRTNKNRTSQIYN